MGTFAVHPRKPSPGQGGLIVKVEIQWVLEGTDRKARMGPPLALTSLSVQETGGCRRKLGVL